MFSNKFLSVLVSLETSAQALNFVSAPHASPPVCFWRNQKTSFSGSQIGAGGYVWRGCRGERPVAPNRSHLPRWDDTFFKKEAVQRPFAATVTRKHLDSHCHLSQTWLELPGLSHFLSTVAHITGGRFHLFQYSVDDKSDPWELSDVGSWAGFQTNCGRNQDNLFPIKGITKTTKAKRGCPNRFFCLKLFLRVNQCWGRDRFKQ